MADVELWARIYLESQVHQLAPPWCWAWKTYRREAKDLFGMAAITAGD